MGLLTIRAAGRWLLVVAFLTLLAGGAFWLGQRSLVAEEDVQQISSPVLVRPSDVVDDAAQPARLVLLWGDTVSVTSFGLEGRITGVASSESAIPGMRLVEVDGAWVHLMVGDRPLHRPVSAGMEGDDVDALFGHVASVLGDAAPAPTARLTAGMIRDYHEMRGARVRDEIRPEDVLFAPAGVEGITLTVAVGDGVSDGIAVAESSPPLVQAQVELDGDLGRVSALRDGLGESGLTFAGHDLNLTLQAGDVGLTANERHELRRKLSGAATPDSIEGQVRLQNPPTKKGLPATAVVESRPGAVCLVRVDQADSREATWRDLTGESAVAGVVLVEASSDERFVANPRAAGLEGLCRS